MQIQISPKDSERIRFAFHRLLSEFCNPHYVCLLFVVSEADLKILPWRTICGKMKQTIGSSVLLKNAQPKGKNMTDKTDTANSVIGMSEADAKKAIEAAGLTSRVKFRDGVPSMGTCDCNMQRVNLSIDAGKVTSVSFG